MLIKSKIMSAISAAAAALAMAAPAVANAATDGVQDNYQEYNSKTSQWGDSTTKNTVAKDPQHNGRIRIEYETNGGWEDPGKDVTTPDDNGSHDAGTFIVTIPTLIKHTNMKAGTVEVTDKYTVNVRGSIPGDKRVHLAANEYNVLGNPDDNDFDNDSLQETTTQGKTYWSAYETYGSLAVDGKALLGTDTTDTIELSGQAKTSGTYTGTVAYTATLEDVPQRTAK